jgi:isopenicillin N synthase-like dioxygenase
MSFATIPILDLSLSRDPATKPGFLQDLRSALLEVGFLYISKTGIDESLIERVIRNGKAFFDLPESEKLAVQMKNAKSFLGWYLHAFSFFSLSSDLDFIDFCFAYSCIVESVYVDLF